jgi:hypothetical protein
VPSGASAWRLEGFGECLDEWAARDLPSGDLRVVVTAWVITRFDDPYQGVRREPGFENLWFGPVPGSGDGQGNAVACSYWIEEAARTVRCDSIATLSQPI